VEVKPTEEATDGRRGSYFATSTYDPRMMEYDDTDDDVAEEEPVVVVLHTMEEADHPRLVVDDFAKTCQPVVEMENYLPYYTARKNAYWWRAIGQFVPPPRPHPRPPWRIPPHNPAFVLRNTVPWPWPTVAAVVVVVAGDDDDIAAVAAAVVAVCDIVVVAADSMVAAAREHR
jgi:hypothetical protein